MGRHRIPGTRGGEPAWQASDEDDRVLVVASLGAAASVRRTVVGPQASSTAGIPSTGTSKDPRRHEESPKSSGDRAASNDPYWRPGASLTRSGRPADMRNDGTDIQEMNESVSLTQFGKSGKLNLGG